MYFLFCMCCICSDAHLTLVVLMWRIWWASNNVCKWQMGFNSAFKGLNCAFIVVNCIFQVICVTLAELQVWRKQACLFFYWFVYWHSDLKGPCSNVNADNNCMCTNNIEYHLWCLAPQDPRVVRYTSLWILEHYNLRIY